ncbi:MAG: DUF6884 domain-containing protein [Candidatus Nanopelagicales bacterium]
MPAMANLLDQCTYAPPTPGRALVMSSGFVSSVSGRGPKDGGRWGGVPLSIGPTTTLLRRGDGTEMRLPNDDLEPAYGMFFAEALRLGVIALSGTPGWDWIGWTVADHIAYEQRNPQPELVIVPCGAKKKDESGQRADEIYTGTYHRLALKAARRLVPADRIRILSAKYGLLRLHQYLDPYELRLGDVAAVSEKDLRAQAKMQWLQDVPNVTVLAGGDYAALSKRVWPQAKTPLAGTRGIGDQQHRLVCIAEGQTWDEAS